MYDSCSQVATVGDVETFQISQVNVLLREFSSSSATREKKKSTISLLASTYFANFLLQRNYIWLSSNAIELFYI